MRILLAAIAAMMASGSAVAATADQGEMKHIEQALRDGCKATERGDVEGMMAPFPKGADITVFDFGTPRSRDYASLYAATAGFPKMIKGAPFCQYTEIHPVQLSADAAYSWSILHFGGETTTGQKIDLTMRSTDVWRKIAGAWKIVHEHNSFPVDMATGKPDLQSLPRP